jgi:DNA-binding XRE family transcriptional regulator
MTILTEQDVINIRKEVLLGTKQTKVARTFGVSKQIINYIVKRKTWTHI